MHIRSFLRFRLQRPEDGGDAGVAGAAPAPVAAEPAAAPAAPVSAPPAGPASMLEAISATLDASQGTEPAPGQPRDPQGRFAPRDANGALIPATSAVAPAKPAAPAVPGAPVVSPVTETPEDLTVMPEGLQPKAQERFQRLANTNKEQAALLEQREEQIGYVRDTFQREGINQQQFEQAASVIGMMNKGDWRGALAALDEQRKHISMQLGEELPGVDALADFPDLRQAVDDMQISGPMAMELARNRAHQLAGQQQQQAQQRQQETQQVQQQAVHAGTQEVDALCKQLAASDLDFTTIEAQLLPVIPQLLSGLPPNQWKNAVKTQYDLMKRMASTVRQNSQAPGAVLRPTGQASPGTAPKSAYDAMWGAK